LFAVGAVGPVFIEENVDFEHQREILVDDFIP
jgi:hypothetical protein